MPLSKARMRERKRQDRMGLFPRNGICQSCGRDGLIDRHHIDKDRSNNNPDNLVLLCPNCHADIHRNNLNSQLSNAGLIIKGNGEIEVKPKSNLNRDIPPPYPPYSPPIHGSNESKDSIGDIVWFDADGYPVYDL